MADTSALDLARRIVIAHERLDRNGLLTMPSVHDELHADHDLLSSVAARYEGAFFYCDGENPNRAGPLNAPLAHHLSAMFSGRGLPIQITEEDNQIVVTAEDYPEPTGSIPVILDVVSTLVSQDVEGWRLVLIGYPLEGLDDLRAALLWDACLALENFPPTALETFVPIAGGDVDVAAHCSRAEGAVRLIVREGELIVRGTPTLLQDALNTVLPSRDLPIVLFLGAGASASARIPQGNYVRDLSLVNLLGQHTHTELVREFRRWLTEHDRWMSGEKDLPGHVFARNLTLERALREEFFNLAGLDREHSRTVTRLRESCEQALLREPPGRLALRRLAELLPRLVVATVNFDELIEADMTHPHEVIVGDGFETHRELVLERLSGETDTLPILKVHGTISDLDSLVADINSTSRGLPDPVSSTLDAMVEHHRPLTWVWLGCSMRDADIGTWLNSRDGWRDLREWWVDPLPPASVAEYASHRRGEEWARMSHTLRDRQVTETTDLFLPRLVQRAESLLAAE